MTRSRRIAFVLVIGLGGVALLSALGFWQTQRLFWKLDLIAELEARQAEPAIALTGDERPEVDNFRNAVAVGAFTNDPPARFLTSERPTGPGYRYIHVFELADGRRILVDRGYVPDRVTPAAPPEGETRVIGALHWPREKTAFTPHPDLTAGRWFARDTPKLAAALDAEPVLLVVSRPATDDPTALWPKPIPPSVDLPNNHLGYAVTWFSLALIWAAMTAILLLRRA